jgi:hypothetical protein
MRLYNVEQLAQEGIIDDTPLFDKSSSGERLKSESKFDKNVFDIFK